MSIKYSSYQELFFLSKSDSLSGIKQCIRRLPAMTRSCHKYTLVLDLDETLIHSSKHPIENPDDVVVLSSGDQKKVFYVKYRPGLFEFLNRVSKFFELVVFTASSREYAEQIINKIDGRRRLLKYRFYREDCTEICGQFVKDLDKLGRDLSKVIIMDNSVTAFYYHLDNGIPITSWFSDPFDRELEQASGILERMAKLDDVRPVLNSMFNLPRILEQFKESMKRENHLMCV